MFFKHFSFFRLRYSTEFGFTIPDRAIIVDDIRVRGTGRSSIDQSFASVFTNDTPTFASVSWLKIAPCQIWYHYVWYIQRYVWIPDDVFITPSRLQSVILKVDTLIPKCIYPRS